MYGHHGSKAAGNMIGHLLGYDLKERGVPIAMIHVSPLINGTKQREETTDLADDTAWFPQDGDDQECGYGRILRQDGR